MHSHFFYPYSKSRFLQSRFISTFIFCSRWALCNTHISLSPPALFVSHDERPRFLSVGGCEAWIFVFFLLRFHTHIINILCEWYYHCFTLKIGYNELNALRHLQWGFCCCRNKKCGSFIQMMMCGWMDLCCVYIYEMIAWQSERIIVYLYSFS